MSFKIRVNKRAGMLSVHPFHQRQVFIPPARKLHSGKETHTSFHNTHLSVHALVSKDIPFHTCAHAHTTHTCFQTDLNIKFFFFFNQSACLSEQMCPKEEIFFLDGSTTLNIFCSSTFLFKKVEILVVSQVWSPDQQHQRHPHCTPKCHKHHSRLTRAPWDTLNLKQTAVFDTCQAL